MFYSGWSYSLLGIKRLVTFLTITKEWMNEFDHCTLALLKQPWETPEKFMPEWGFPTLTSTMPVQCFTSWATTGQIHSFILVCIFKYIKKIFLKNNSSIIIIKKDIVKCHECYLAKDKRVDYLKCWTFPFFLWKTRPQLFKDWIVLSRR